MIEVKNSMYNYISVSNAIYVGSAVFINGSCLNNPYHINTKEYKNWIEGYSMISEDIEYRNHLRDIINNE
jgi:hypothetical protein